MAASRDRAGQGKFHPFLETIHLNWRLLLSRCRPPSDLSLKDKLLNGSLSFPLLLCPSLLPAWMLTCFSCVQLCVTLWTVACQAPLSMGSSRQEYWHGLPCLLQGIFPTQGLNLHFLCLLCCQVGSLPLAPLQRGNPLHQGQEIATQGSLWSKGSI